MRKSVSAKNGGGGLQGPPWAEVLGNASK